MHHANRQRLEFEALRDTVLADSGQLDLTAGGFSDDLTKEPFTHRRTVYGYIDRQNLPGLFRVFDYPNPDTSSAQRFATTVPQQALYLMNSAFVQEQARATMKRADIAIATTEAEKIRALYRALLQRHPDANEVKLAKEFLAMARSPLPPDTPPAGQATAPSPTKGKKKSIDKKPAEKKTPAIPLTSWEELAQVLLLSNEVAFVD